MLFRECLVAARQEMAELKIGHGERKRKTLTRAKALFRGIREDVRQIKLREGKTKKRRRRT